MKLFSVIYLKGHMIAAMFLWNGATINDCQKINSQYQQTLPTSPGVKSGQVKLSDIRLACEWHKSDPIKNGVPIK